MKYDTYMWNYDRLTEPLRRDFILQFAQEFKKDVESGYVDLALFDSWKRDDLTALMNDPMLFHARREAAGDEGYLKKIQSIYRIGGLALVFRVVKQRIKG